METSIKLFGKVSRKSHYTGLYVWVKQPKLLGLVMPQISLPHTLIVLGKLPFSSPGEKLKGFCALPCLG